MLPVEIEANEDSWSTYERILPWLVYWAGRASRILAIYEPIIYTVLYVMPLMRANPLRGQVGGGWTLETFWAL
jgi:hypothetical protein